ncbi:hypothetical protein [Collimonas pratensis]|uniref:Uncharacterized protein n=1 Tax=Collimonas pratensis TaxID=279113 RepID=A0A127Q8W7_9BURK|nr:hypothetical protein [Collimonas pratensis]AMP06509.1 hypothetical protein CPter91_4194 [Collimonas pratensis]
MSSEDIDLVEWCQQAQIEARRQTELFSSGGVKAILQMPDGTTQDITAGVIKHQTENMAVFERLISALK